MLHLDGERHRLGGPEKRAQDRRARDARPLRLRAARFRPDGPGHASSAPREDFVGWVYADPDGSEHNTVNCSVADMDARRSRGPGLPPLTLDRRGGAAYELGMRETDHGIPIQPFGDG